MTLPRPSLVPAVMATLLGLFGPVLAPGAAAGAASPPRSDEPATPLQITLSSMTPSAVPARGVITLSGKVSNVSGEDWTDINVAPIVSSTPLTTREQVDEAAQSDPAADVGDRLFTNGLYATIGDLPPGASADFSIQLPRRELPISGASGVYWIGVHALGANAEGRDDVADGRARTFIPLLPAPVARRTPVNVSVVVPLRARVPRDPEGRLADPDRFAALLGDSGRLGRVVGFTATAGDNPLTVVTDPAVLDAADSLIAGNPRIGFTDPNQPGQQASVDEKDEREGVTRWLAAATALLEQQPSLAVGYADPDAAAVSRTAPRLMNDAQALTQASSEARRLAAGNVVAPPSGNFDPSLVDRLSQGTVLLLGDHGLDHDQANYALPGGKELVLADSRTDSGGPGPTPPLDPLAMRQRILADTAVMSLDGATSPLVVQFPPAWDPGPKWSSADFFGGLGVPWVNLVAVPRGSQVPFPSQLTYTPQDQAAETSPAAVSAARTLMDSTAVLGELFGGPTTGVPTLRGMALDGVSYAARLHARAARSELTADQSTVRRLIDKVGVDGSSFVTLSGSSGSLTVSIANDLDHPVTVGLRARTDDGRVQISTPPAVRLGARKRTTVRLQVRTDAVGVHQISLTPVTTSGKRAGQALTFSLRSSQVGLMIWIIMAVAGALLVVMIALRIVRRIRTHTWDLHGDEASP